MKGRQQKKDRLRERDSEFVLQSFRSSLLFATLPVFAVMQNNFGLCSSPGHWPQGQTPTGDRCQAGMYVGVRENVFVCVCVCVSE